jgi:hypothetical protein
VRPRRNVAVVAADQAWKLYSEKGQAVYVFPAARSIQLVDYVAFYSEQEIKPVIPKIVQHFPAVNWNNANSRRLLKSTDSGEVVVGRAIAASMAAGWSESSYQVFVLTAKGDPETVTLSGPITHSRRGAGSAFVRAHRYMPLSSLLSARNTADLKA